MDCRHYKRNETPRHNFSIPQSRFPLFSDLTLNIENALTPANNLRRANARNYVLDYNIPIEKESKLLGMKIFSTVMLNAWRKRRDDIKQLTIKVQDLKRNSMKTRNQIHVYHTLFRVEQKRNEEMTLQLKNSIESIHNARTSCESLTTKIISLQSEKALLEQELRLKFKDIEALADVLGQTKTELVRSLLDQRILQANLLKEKREVQFLHCQKNKLLNEVVQLNTEKRKMEESQTKENCEKDEQLDELKQKIEILEKDLEEAKRKEKKIAENKRNDAFLKIEVLQLQEQVSQLQKKIDGSIDTRIRVTWIKLRRFQKTSLQLAHLLAFILLPATPPPRLSFPFKEWIVDHVYFTSTTT